jgi:peptidylprolyl isomerase
VIEVDRQQLPTEIEPAVGQQLQVREESGAVIPVVITDITDESITLDANHPLAGEELTFDIQLVDISA